MMNVDKNKCVGCGKCVKDCFLKDIEMIDGKAHINNQSCIKCGHCIAVCPKDAVTIDEYNMDEVKEYNEKEFVIDADNLLNFIKFRRSVRQFENKDIEEKKIAKIIESGRFTQTGINLQDVSYIVVKDKIDELRNLTLETLSNMGKDLLASEKPEAILFAKYAKLWIKMHEDYKADPIKNDKLFCNAPVVIIVTANMPVNGGLASSNMELMTNALGLGTFFSGFLVKAAQENKKIMEILGVKEGKQIVSCMVIGYPKVKYLRTVPRKEADVMWM